MVQRRKSCGTTHQTHALSEITQRVLDANDPGQPADGGTHASRRALEQADLQVALELADGLGQRRLRKTHLLRGATHAASTGDHTKRFQVAKIQGVNFIHRQLIAFTYDLIVKRIWQH